MKKIALLLMAIVLMVSCKQANKNQSANVGTQAIDPSQLTRINFTEDHHDFGKVTDGEMVSYSYKFKNTGDKPLIISNVRASCGCTTPNWAKDPIAPGQEGNIDVKFNSVGRVGMQEKLITVTANTNPAQTELHLFGEVLAK